MAVPASKTERAKNVSGFAIVTSTIVTVGTTITLDGIVASKTHCFVGAQFFDDAAGTIVATPTAGTVTIAIQTLNSEPAFEDPPTPTTIDPTAPTTLSWSGNTLSVRATPTGIADATHYRIVVTCNET